MYYLYKLMPNRRLVTVRNGYGERRMYSDKELADGAAKWASIDTGYPIEVSEDADLDGTVDGKQDAMAPTLNNLEN